MSETYEFDLVAIGSGPAGQRAAVQAAKLGKRVAVIEKNRYVGGVCVETGTIPSKTFREAVWAVSSAPATGARPTAEQLLGARQRRRPPGDRCPGPPAPPQRHHRDPGRGGVPGSPHPPDPVGGGLPRGAGRDHRRRRGHAGLHTARDGGRRGGGDHQRRHHPPEAPAADDDGGGRRRHRDRVRVDLRHARDRGHAWSSGATACSTSWTARSWTSSSTRCGSATSPSASARPSSGSRCRRARPGGACCSSSRGSGSSPTSCSSRRAARARPTG